MIFDDMDHVVDTMWKRYSKKKKKYLEEENEEKVENCRGFLNALEFGLGLKTQAACEYIYVIGLVEQDRKGLEGETPYEFGYQTGLKFLKEQMERLMKA